MHRFPLALLCAAVVLPFGAAGSMILDRAPEAGSVVEVFVEPDGLRLEWDPESKPPSGTLEITADGRALTPDDGYRFEGRPASITIAPPAGAKAGEIGFVVYHEGLAVTDLHYLDAPETLRLNWSDPWQSRFGNPKLGRVYDSPVGVFLHIGRYQVRVEVLGRPVDFGLDTIDPGAFAEAVTGQLRGQWQLIVEGQPVVPPLDRCEFLERRFRSTQAVSPPPPNRIRSSTLGAVYVMKREDYPADVELEWSYYPPTAPSIAGAVTEDTMFQPRTLSAGSNSLRWEMSAAIKPPELRYVPPPSSPPLRLPGYATPVLAVLLLALSVWTVLQLRARRTVPRTVLLGVFALVVLIAVSRMGDETIDDRAAAPILEGLIHNIYRAYDHPDEEPVYDTLAQSIAGETLTDTYLDVRRALEVERTGGARIRVREVNLEEAVSEPDGSGFRATCRWTVAGSVAHWGHVHTRRNLYEAEVTVRPVDGAWKVTRLEMVNQERI